MVVQKISKLADSKRCRKLIDEAIDSFSLSLDCMNVLTEAASGYYILTPLIAALAGSSKVFALAKDSHYGQKEAIQNDLYDLSCEWSVQDRIEVLFTRDDPRIKEADIVTNLGFVRPLNRCFLQQLKETAVVPLMWETWEHRPDELDLEACHELGIPVLGTNERHPNLMLFSYIGPLAAKLLLESRLELFRSRIAVVGGSEWAGMATDLLCKLGADAKRLVPDVRGGLISGEACAVLQESEALLFLEHHLMNPLIGEGAELSIGQLKDINPDLKIVHLCGNVPRQDLVAAGFSCFPEFFAKQRYMTRTTDYLGPRPLIDLHTAGLRVGEVMARARKRGICTEEVEEMLAKDCPIAQGFTPKGINDSKERG